jgi:uncharacterized protein CbrC (UPF0167 family)
MATKKPPVWGWEGVTECPDCGDEVDFFREEGWEDVAQVMESMNWVVQVYHNHGNPDWPEGRWQVALYQKYKGRQRPPIVKDAEAQRKAAYNARQEKKKVANASA